MIVSKGIILHKHGGPEALLWEDITVGSPGPGQVLLRQTAIGLNFIDVYHRTGLYQVSLPGSIGSEAAGVVEKVGDGVVDLKVGQRVAYAGGPPGAYVEARVMPADRLVPLPDGIEDKVAAAIMLQGMTTEYLLERTYPVKKGETILFHAAAGGVGLLAVQWAKSLGATVIGTVGSTAKADLAKAHGADHVIDYSREDFVARVKEITGGKGVPVVYDSVGKDTFLKSLDCLEPLGLMVLFGASSGSVPDFNLTTLAGKGSLYVTRPTLNTYNATVEDLRKSAKRLFDQVLSGKVKPNIGQTYKLSDAAQAHSDLEGRKTTGATVLVA
jgi:NADPH2:quinone reductase